MDAKRFQSVWQGPGAAMPRALFLAGQGGALWDATVPSTLFTDTAGTTRAGLAAAVARVNDRSGNGNNLTQASAALRPVRALRPTSLAVLGFDQVDDIFASAAFAGGLAGQAAVIGEGGLCVTSLTIAPAGTFSIGGANHNWTGADPGILRAVSGNTGRLLAVAIRAGVLTEPEITALEAWAKAFAVPGLMAPSGANLLANGNFAGGATGWSIGGGWTVASGLATASTTSSSLLSTTAVTPGRAYCVEFNMTSYTSGSLAVRLGGSPHFLFTGAGPKRAFFWATTPAGVELYGGSINAQIDDVVVRPYLARG